MGKRTKTASGSIGSGRGKGGGRTARGRGVGSVLPLAEELGLGRLTVELEDLQQIDWAHAAVDFRGSSG